MKTINFKLIKKVKITGRIKLLTGLCIGGSDTGMDIGGLDKTIVRNPLTGKPYIPGSSLKGKMRALLELKAGAITEKNNTLTVKYVGSDEPKYLTSKLFGNSRNDEHQRPSRLIVRDCDIIEDSFENKNLILPYAEVKTEVAIDRITAKANPRTIERVPAGAEFNLEMILNLFCENDKEDVFEDYKKLIEEGFELLEIDYLGGNGSRGYGQVKFIFDNNKYTELPLTI